MDLAPVQSRIGRTGIEMLYVEPQEQVIHKPRLIPFEVLYPQRRVVRPVVPINEKALSKCPLASDHDARRRCHCGIVKALDAPTRHHRNRSIALLIFRNIESALKCELIAYRCFYPPHTPLRENGLQVAFKQGAGVLEVLFGVGFGGGDAVEGFVEEGDDAVLFGEWRNGKRHTTRKLNVQIPDCRPRRQPIELVKNYRRAQQVIKETLIKAFFVVRQYEPTVMDAPSCLHDV